MTGPQAGLAAVDAITGLADHAWWHASRVELLVRLDRPDEASAALTRAVALGLGRAHVDRLEQRVRTG